MDSCEDSELVRTVLEWLDSIYKPFTFDDCEKFYVHTDEKEKRRLVTVPEDEEEG